MLGIGFFEMIVIAGVALVVIGPERFPDVAKIAVKTLRELRGYMDEMKTEISKELKPVEKELRSLKEHNPEKYIDSLSKPVVSSASPYNREEGQTGEGGELADTDETDAVESDTVSEPDEADAPNPEPEANAWQQEPYGGEEDHKVAGKDEFDDFKGPERLD